MARKQLATFGLFGFSAVLGLRPTISGSGADDWDVDRQMLRRSGVDVNLSSSPRLVASEDPRVVEDLDFVDDSSFLRDIPLIESGRKGRGESFTKLRSLVRSSDSLTTSNNDEEMSRSGRELGASGSLPATASTRMRCIGAARRHLTPGNVMRAGLLAALCATSAGLGAHSAGREFLKPQSSLPRQYTLTPSIPYTMPAITGPQTRVPAAPYHSSGDVPSASGNKGDSLGYACVDWSIGSRLWEQQQMLYNHRTGENVLFGVGSYGSGKENIGKCYKMNLEGLLGASSLILQVVNSGGDVAQGNFDLQQLAGGVGLFNCLTNIPNWPDNGQASQSSSPFGMLADQIQASNAPLGDHMYGGFADRGHCAQLPQVTDPLYAQGHTSFPNGEKSLPQLCEAAFDHGTRRADGGNPRILKSERVQCPHEVIEVTQYRRKDELNGVAPGTEVKMSGQLTRMFDGCKPSGSWPDGSTVGNMGVVSCARDGITRWREDPLNDENPTDF